MTPPNDAKPTRAPDVQQSGADVARRTENGDAPVRQGATTEHTG